MSQLLNLPPYAEREDRMFLDEMNALTSYHSQWCEPFRNIVGQAHHAERVEDVPFLHVGLFKRIPLVSHNPDAKILRTVLSSSTSGVASRVSLDEQSSQLQAKSSQAILADFVGSEKRPLLVLDSVNSLRRRDDFSARIMAAMSLKPFATEVFFLLKDAGDPMSLSISQLECALKQGGDLLVYGFSWILWLAWAGDAIPADLRQELGRRKIAFVHSGGWKKLEDQKVSHETFDSTLLQGAAAGSVVVDYYGLVEQMGIVFPMCIHGSRHVPRWADVLVRDSWTLDVLPEGEGQIQLINSITFGSPCHSVLTEDMGRLLPGDCACGRKGRRFELIGRVPKAEVRGCANV
ncbi:hypothetical protein [Massilia sp. LjRoot122]|uniref:LuxE/PaaK family acyltransferase n=1 Tax=Massilia sp. LjRoot122 TaxID=3342257 RepID=UPI003ECECBBF